MQSRKITDTMTIAAAHAIADFAYQRGITVDNIIPKMSENDVFPYVAAEVAMQARKEGLARLPLTKKEVYDMAQQDISDAQKTINISPRISPKNFFRMRWRRTTWSAISLPTEVSWTG